jgi:hypothetical protein
MKIRLFLSASVAALTCAMPLRADPDNIVFDSTTMTISDGSGTRGEWYHLPSFGNYSPGGLPDFDQKQDPSWKWTDPLGTEHWSYFGLVATTDIFWWFDSRYADPGGFPGDNEDIYRLVQKDHPNGDGTVDSKDFIAFLNDFVNPPPGC